MTVCEKRLVPEGSRRVVELGTTSWSVRLPDPGQPRRTAVTFPPRDSSTVISTRLLSREVAQ